ncbi:MAG: CapA family protein, partial [bacterium]
GVEGKHFPLPFQRDLAHRIIDDGALLVLGHHPHVMQGIERYKNGVIVYSLGNFFFPDVVSPFIKEVKVKQKPENLESFMLECEISPDGTIEYNQIPIFLNNNLQVCPADGLKSEEILDKIKEFSTPLQNEQYDSFYRKTFIKGSGYWSRLKNIIKRDGFSGIKNRLRPCYIRAVIDEARCKYIELMHRRQFYLNKFCN